MGSQSPPPPGIISDKLDVASDEDPCVFDTEDPYDHPASDISQSQTSRVSEDDADTDDIYVETLATHNDLAQPGRMISHDQNRRRDDSAEDGTDSAEMSSWAGQPSVKGSSEAVRMVLLNFATIGISFTWGVEMTYCTPYLLALGLSKQNTSLVWIAGPLSGLLVQPLVGAFADESTSRWGRRRPFIMIGSLISAFFLLVLGFTKNIVGFFIPNETAARSLTITMAVLAIYAVDFCVNAVMSTSRSLVVDTLPISKQQTGAAWGGRIGAIGHMLAYLAGSIDLTSKTGNFLGDTQFQKLTVIAALAITGAACVTCWAVNERVLVSVRHDPRSPKGNFKFVRQIWYTLLHLPPRIQAICWVQFWSWIGWFPFLFYSTTWVGETYFRYDVPDDQRSSKDALGQIGRVGSTALVIYSMITLAGAWILPLLIKAPEEESFTPRPPRVIAPAVAKLNRYKPDLLTAWWSGHALFSFAMFLAPFARSYRFATVLVALCGLPWTVAGWAPTTFLGVEVNRLESSTASYRRLSSTSVEMAQIPNVPPSCEVLHLEHDDELVGKPTGSTGELSGIYFGILNIYNTLPQFIGTFISSIVFSILEPGKSPELANDAADGEVKVPRPDGPNAIAVCLFIGSFSAAVAVFQARKLRHM